MEYVSRINIFELKMMVKKWSKKIIYEISPFAKPFLENIFYFIGRRFLSQNENDLLCAWTTFNEMFCVVSAYNK